jgi:2-oxoglutarate ferredoxin oxidoreductase subunit alpha
LAVTYRTPVILLSDGYLANGAEPWRLPDLSAIPPIEPGFASEPNHVAEDGTPSFQPYIRDPVTLARPWAPPGVPGLEHRIGGLEKADETGNVSYDGLNHEAMVRWRAAKIAGIAKVIPAIEVDGEDDAELLVLGWGSTFGAINAGVARARARGRKVAQAHLDNLNPFPLNLGEVLHRYPKVLVPEMNLGQLSKMVRAEFLVDAKSLNKTQGVPFLAGEIEDAIIELLEGEA